MVSLRLQEFLDAKGLMIAELSQLTGISENLIQAYVQNSIELNTENAENFRKIAARLNVPVAKLIRPSNKQAGVSFKIVEKAKSQGLDLTDLSERSNTHPLILAIYSTQVLLKDKWAEAQTQDNIHRIATELNSTPQELVVVKDPPITQLRMGDFLQEKGLSLEELSLLSNIPAEALDLLVSQPFDLTSFRDLERDWILWPSFCCEYLWCCRSERWL